MKYVISRFNHDTDWISKYTSDYILYDRSEKPVEGSVIVPNIGSDIFDKLSFIIDNYSNLPTVAVYTKCNLFKYITKEEWDIICNNKTFTPIFSKHSPESMIEIKVLEDAIETGATQEEKDLVAEILEASMRGEAKTKRFCFYDEDGMYNELNTSWYINSHPVFGETRVKQFERIIEVQKLVGIWGKEYLQFAPGSNYILPKENILKHPKEFYEKLKSYIDHDVYSGECMIIERGLHQIWK